MPSIMVVQLITRLPHLQEVLLHIYSMMITLHLLQIMVLVLIGAKREH